MEIEYLQWFLQNFYFLQEVDVQYKRESLESWTQKSTRLFEIDDFNRLITNIYSNYEDFLAEDKETGRLLEVMRNFHR